MLKLIELILWRHSVKLETKCQKQTVSLWSHDFVTSEVPPLLQKNMLIFQVLYKKLTEIPEELNVGQNKHDIWEPFQGQ